MQNENLGCDENDIHTKEFSILNYNLFRSSPASQRRVAMHAHVIRMVHMRVIDLINADLTASKVFVEVEQLSQ